MWSPIPCNMPDATIYYYMFCPTTVHDQSLEPTAISLYLQTLGFDPDSGAYDVSFIPGSSEIGVVKLPTFQFALYPSLEPIQVSTEKHQINESKSKTSLIKKMYTFASESNYHKSSGR